jgi:hypothetical protein
MLVFRYIPDPESAQGEWFERVLWGQTIRIKIRPINDEIRRKIRNRPDIAAMKEGPEKEDALFDAYYDHIVEDFKDLADETKSKERAPWKVNIDNKKRLLSMPVPHGEENNLIFAANKANQLAFDAYEEEIKN